MPSACTIASTRPEFPAAKTVTCSASRKAPKVPRHGLSARSLCRVDEEQMVLGDVREGLSVVDVALLDARDRELPYYATSSFHVASGGTCPVGASTTCRLATIGC
jgi:hypothetical protein